MDERLKAAVETFEDTLLELDATKSALEAIKASAPAEEWHLHINRLIFARAQVSAVQNMVVQLAAAFKSARRGTKLALPKAAYLTAITGLRGGTAVLSGVIYGARQFIAQAQNPNAPSPLAGVLAGINWAALGGVIGLLEQGMRK